ncbi:PPC domain-containing protein [Chloroflexota bacterium]
MASLWEILDPSNVRYNTSLGNDRADSGEGPPSFMSGWVRTGYDSDNGTEPGQANCDVWSSTAGYGTVVSLPADWTDLAKQDVWVWDAAIRACSNDAGVWCVQDPPQPGTCRAPLELECGQEVSGDTSAFPDNVSTYDCSAWNESGPETVYRFTLPPGGDFPVTAQLSGMTVDLDLFLLSSGGCSSGQCADTASFGDHTIEIEPLSPGTYQLVVDGYLGAAGSYTLELDCARRVYLPTVVRKADGAIAGRNAP